MGLELYIRAGTFKHGTFFNLKGDRFCATTAVLGRLSHVGPQCCPERGSLAAQGEGATISPASSSSSASPQVAPGLNPAWALRAPSNAAGLVLICFTGC